MALMEKKRYQGRRLRKRTNRKRRRTGLFVFIGLAILTFGAFIFFGVDLTSNRGVEQVAEPTVTETPGTASKKASDKERASDEEQASGEEQASDQTSEREEEAAPVPPNDPTMYLTIPKLGISGAMVIGSEAGLEVGGQLVNGGYPWLPGSNTYIAGHRLGFPGTGSDHIFYNLPSLAPGDELILYDSLGQAYRYRVSETLQVEPTDLSVLSPVAGRDVVTLQTCIENYGDFATLGPNWNVRYLVRADRV